MMHDAGAPVSANLHMLEFQQKLQHALTLSDGRGACQMCFQGSTDLGRLCEHGCSVKAAARVATSCFLDSILVLATAGLGKPEQQKQTTNPTKSAILSMIATVSEHARNPAFIASAMVDNEMADSVAILDPAVHPANFARRVCSVRRVPPARGFLLTLSLAHWVPSSSLGSLGRAWWNLHGLRWPQGHVMSTRPRGRQKSRPLARRFVARLGTRSIRTVRR